MDQYWSKKLGVILTHAFGSYVQEPVGRSDGGGAMMSHYERTCPPVTANDNGGSHPQAVLQLFSLFPFSFSLHFVSSEVRTSSLFALILQALGQNSVQTFNWKFKNDTVSTRLTACSNYDLMVFPNLNNATAGNFSGVPPYYMMVFPQGGQPITRLAGVDNDTLSWMPTHPV
ncbi:hypothetical protein P691DRAFT_782959, partial [Macrolepiota fuliginosa MF-IS2]